MRTLKKTRGRYLMVLLAMSGMIASSLGILTNTAGIFFAPIAQELAKDTSAVNATLTICNLVFALSGMLAARIINTKNFRAIICASSLIFTGATAALALCHSLASLYALNAVRGFAAGMVGNVLVTTVIGSWFQSDTGFISSIALACSGLAGALLNPVLEAVIQSVGWRGAYLTAAGIILLLNLPAMLLPISLRPEDAGLEPLREKSTDRNHQANAPQDRFSALPGVFALSAVAIAFTSFCTSVPQLFKGIGSSYGFRETGVLMLTVCLIANTVGKFLFGGMADKYGTKRAFSMYGIIVTAGLTALYALRSALPMLFSAACIGLCYSLPTVGAVMLCRELFSPERYRQVFPKINLACTVANAMGYPILGSIFDRTGSYDLALILVISMAVVSIVSVLFAYRLAAK